MSSGKEKKKDIKKKYKNETRLRDENSLHGNRKRQLLDIQDVWNFLIF